MIEASARRSLPRDPLAITAAAALLAFALRGSLAIDPDLLEVDGLLEWFTFPKGLWLPLVSLGSAALAWRRRTRWRELAPAPLLAPASVACAAASLAAGVWARLTGVADPWVFAASFAGAALASRRGGWRGVGVQALPLAFLLFAVAPPPRWVSEAYWWIQSGSARAATALVRATGKPVLGEGIVLTTPEEVFGIIESCTALGILVVLTAAAVLAREAIRDAGPRSWCLVLAAPFVAMLLNLARITAIVLHPGLNQLHHVAQWAILLAIGALLLAALAAVLVRGRPRRLTPPPSPPTSGSARVALPALALGALLAAVSLLPTPKPRSEAPTLPVREIPMQHGDWVATPAPVDSLFLGYVVFRERVARRYERKGQLVNLFVGEASPRSDWSSPFSPKTVLPGMGWVPVPDPPPTRGIELPLPPTQTAWVARDAQRWWVVQWRFGDPGAWLEGLRQLLALDASPFGVREPRRVIRLASPLPEDAPDGVERAQRAVAAFAADFAPLLFPEARVTARARD